MEKEQIAVDTGNTHNKAKEDARKRDLELMKQDFFCINLTHQTLKVGRRFFIGGTMFDIPKDILENINVKAFVPQLSGTNKWRQMAVKKYSIDDYTNLYSLSEVTGEIPFAIKVKTIPEALNVLEKYYTTAKCNKTAMQIKAKAGNVRKNITDIAPKLKEQQNQHSVEKEQIAKENKQTQRIEKLKDPIPVQFGDAQLNLSALGNLKYLSEYPKIVDELSKIVTELRILNKTILEKDLELSIQQIIENVTSTNTAQKDTSKYYGEMYKNLMLALDGAIVVAISEIKAKNKTPSLSGVFKQIFFGGGLLIENGKDKDNKQLYILSTSDTYGGLFDSIKMYATSDEKSSNFTGTSWEWYKNEWCSYSGVDNAQAFKDKFFIK